MEEISSQELYKGLLAFGMFTEKLPPVFTTEPYYQYSQTLSSIEYSKDHDYVQFRSMRNINIPRTFGIPAPMAYRNLCLCLSNHWDKITQHFHDQTNGDPYRVSRIHIRKEFGSEQIFSMNYKNWRVDGNPDISLMMNTGRTMKYSVHADISTCFPSMYTHSIPWALVGREAAKSNRDEAEWFNDIDAACRHVKAGETHGLLIGPHASNLVAEIILTTVDRRLRDKKFNFIRNIDDYECYVESHERASLFLTTLEFELRQFDLSLNYKKTFIRELPSGVVENWINQLQSIKILTKEKRVSYTDVNLYLDLSLELAKKFSDSAVLNYAIKELSTCSLTDNAKELAVQRIMHMAALYPYLLPLLDKYVFTPYHAQTDQIKNFSETLYKESKEINNFEGISYSIYFCLKHNFYLSDEIININDRPLFECLPVDDCVAMVLTYLYFLKANHGKVDSTQIKKIKKIAQQYKDTEADRYWLFWYESLPAKDLEGEWKEMKNRGISFIRNEFKL